MLKRILFLLVIVLSCTLGVAAQSTDPKSPTPLTADEIAGGEIEELASYYFSFEGGPGEVTAALAAKMKKGAKGGSVGVELFDANAKSLTSALVSGGLEGGKEKLEQALLGQLGKLTSAAGSVGSDTKEKTARVKVKQKQPLVLKLTVDKGVESFTLKVGGAIEFAQEVPADGGITSPDTTGNTGVMPTDPTSDQTSPTEPITPPEEPTPIDPAAATQDETTPSDTIPTGEAIPPPADVQPTSGKPAVLVIPGKKKPAVLRIPGKQAPPQTQTKQPKPPLVIMEKPRPAPQKSAPLVKKPAMILIPKKKQS